MVTRFVILACGGEYDDFWQCPIAVAQDQATALLLAEAIENHEAPYFSQILSNGFEYLRDYHGLGANVQGVPEIII